MPRLNILIALFTVLAAAGAATVSAETYVIDPVHSSIGFSVRHMVISNVKGTFDKFEGKIEFDPDHVDACSVEFSIETESLNTKNEERDADVSSGEFLDATNHPKITFKSRKVSRVDNDWRAVGDLTIRGVTKEVELAFALNGPITNPWGQIVIGIEVETLKINRQDFGVSWNKKMDNGGLIVSDDVKIDIQLEAKQDG